MIPTKKLLIQPTTLEQFISQLSEKESFDNSSINTFMQCRRLYLYNHEWNLQGKEEAAPLTYGDAVHEAMYAWYSGQGEDEALKAFIKRCAQPDSMIEMKLDITKGSKQKYSVEWGIFILQKYFRENSLKSDPFETLTDDDGKPYLEVGFAVNAGEGVFVGRIDRIARYKETGEIYIIDHKTTQGQLSAAYWQQYNPNNQFMGYMWGVQELLGEMPAGCVINAIRNYQFKKDMKKGEKLEEKIFARNWIKPTFDQVQDRAKEVRETIIDIKSARLRGIYAFYRNAPNACGAWRGCEFLPVCSSRTADVAQLVAAGSYQIRHWFPYDDLKPVKRFEMVL